MVFLDPGLIMLSALTLAPALGKGLIAALGLDLSRLALIFLLGTVPQKLVLGGAFTTASFGSAPPWQLWAISLVGPLVLLLQKKLWRLGLFGLVFGLWQLWGGS